MVVDFRRCYSTYDYDYGCGYHTLLLDGYYGYGCGLCMRLVGGYGTVLL